MGNIYNLYCSSNNIMLILTIYYKSQKLYRTLYDRYLSLGNFTELILYIYITDNIDKKILNLFKFDFGIKKIT